MNRQDIPQATDIDQEAFTATIPATNFGRELNSPLAHYIIAGEDLKKPGDWRYINGFAGFWAIAGEAHIVNIAVRESHRLRGIGELLLIALIELALKVGCHLVTLEVRASNTAAHNLYYKYGFILAGLRHHYYSDNKEDAVILTLENIKAAPFQGKFKQLKQAHREKWK
jgi:ribosomal-protein-alanine N-acetyltransferase